MIPFHTKEDYYWFWLCCLKALAVLTLKNQLAATITTKNLPFVWGVKLKHQHILCLCRTFKSHWQYIINFLQHLWQEPVKALFTDTFFLILLSMEFNPCGILIISAAAGIDTCIQVKDRLSTVQWVLDLLKVEIFYNASKIIWRHCLLV